MMLGLMLLVLAFGVPSPRRIGLTLIGAATAAKEAAGMAPPIYGIKIPQGYRRLEDDLGRYCGDTGQ